MIPEKRPQRKCVPISSSAAAFSAYKAKIEEMERDGFEIYYVEDPDDQPVEEGVSDWCEFKLIDESFDGTNRTYTLRYTIATKEELETWYEKRLSDDGYLKILKTVESYYSSGAFCWIS